MKTLIKNLAFVSTGCSYLSKKATIILPLLLISLVVYATINIPPEHSTRGVLSDSIQLCSECDSNLQWTFINETNCEVTIRQFVTFFGPDGNGRTHHLEEFVVPPMDINTGNFGQASLSFASMFQQLSNLTNSSGPFTITHASVEIKIAGNWGHYGYPDMPTTFCNISIPKGEACRCIQWIPDYANRTMRIISCKCPDENGD